MNWTLYPKQERFWSEAAEQLARVISFRWPGVNCANGERLPGDNPQTYFTGIPPERVEQFRSIIQSWNEARYMVSQGITKDHLVAQPRIALGRTIVNGKEYFFAARGSRKEWLKFSKPRKPINLFWLDKWCEQRNSKLPPLCFFTDEARAKLCSMSLDSARKWRQRLGLVAVSPPIVRQVERIKGEFRLS